MIDAARRQAGPASVGRESCAERRVEHGTGMWTRQRQVQMMMTRIASGGVSPVSKGEKETSVLTCVAH